MSQTKAQLVSGTTAQDLTVDNINTTSVNSGQLSNRNMIINGAINVSQRKGTTQTTVPHDTSFYTVDRFVVFDKIDGGDNFTYQQTTAPVPDGFEYALKINTAIADSSISSANYAFFYQIVEGDNIQQANLGTSAAKPLTLSFHVYSNKTGTYTVGLVNQGTFDRSFLKEFTISQSATWEKKTITFPAITDGNWGDVRVQWALAVGSDHQGAADTLLTSTKLGTSNQVNLANSVNNSFHITGIQLEVGSTATDFEHRSIGDELALCQRYTIALDARGSIDNFAPIGHGRFYNGTDAQIFVHLPTTMRLPPTIDATATTAANTFFLNEDGGFGGHAMTSIALNERSFNSVTVIAQSLGNISGQTVGLGTTIYADDGDDAKLVLTAEL